VAVDEAFMIKECDKSLIWLYQKGVTILVSSLDLSFKGKPFKEIKEMMPWATKIIKCPAVCGVCGEDAFYTYRKSLTEDEIMIGGKEAYDPRCFMHHPLVNKIPGDYE
jgi:thymidine kinase